MRRLVTFLAALLALTSCGYDEEAPIAQSTTTSAAAEPTTAAPAESSGREDWPPPLPPSVPTTGADAWRATWEPEPNSEALYIADLREDSSLTAFTDEDLIGAGYALCGFMYDGVAYEDVAALMAAAGKYDIGQRTSIAFAAYEYFCFNLYDI